MQMQAAMMKKQEQLQMAIQQKKMEEQLLEEELLKVERNNPETMTRYVQQVALPNSNPDENTYMYSTISLDVSIILAPDVSNSKTKSGNGLSEIDILQKF